MSARTVSRKTVEQAASWTTLLESGEMSESQRAAFHAWLEVPRNVRALGEVRNLLSLVQDLPEHNARPLHRIQMPMARFPGLAALLARPLRLAALSTVVVVTLATGAWFGFRPVREFITQTYSSDTGESRTVVLRPVVGSAGKMRVS